MAHRTFQMLTLRCRDATLLISRALDDECTPSERRAIAIHVLTCRSCRRFGRQIRLLHGFVRILSDEDGRERLSPERRAALQEIIRESIS